MNYDDFLKATMLAQQAAPAPSTGTPNPIGTQPGFVADYERYSGPVNAGTSSESTKKEMSPTTQAEWEEMKKAQAAQLIAASPIPYQAPPTATDDTADLVDRVAAGDVNATGTIQKTGPDRTFVRDKEDQFQPPQPTADKYSSKQFSEDLAKQEPKTWAQKQDEIAQFAAESKARQADTYARTLQHLQEEQARRAADTANAIQARARQYAQTLEAKNLWQEMPTLNKALVGIAMAMQTGAKGQSEVYDRLKLAMDQDWSKKQEKMKFAYDQYARAAKAPEELSKWVHDQTAQAQAMREAQLMQTEAAVGRMLAPYPAYQQKAMADLAKLHADMAKDRTELAGKLTSSEQKQGSITPPAMKEVVTGKKEGGGGQVTEAEGKKYTYGSLIKDSVAKIKTGPVLDDKDLKLLNNNILELKSAADNGTKGLFGPAKIEAMKKLGISPASLVEGLSPQKASVAYAWLEGTGLIIRDRSGAAITVPEDFNNWQLQGPQPKDGAKIYQEKVGKLEKNSDLMMKLAGPVAASRAEGKTARPPQTHDTTPPKTDFDLGMRLKSLSPDKQQLYKQTLGIITQKDGGKFVYPAADRQRAKEKLSSLGLWKGR
jgi:hypothetical protein